MEQKPGKRKRESRLCPPSPDLQRQGQSAELPKIEDKNPCLPQLNRAPNSSLGLTFEDSESTVSRQKRVRFPKGKKVKHGNEIVQTRKDDNSTADLTNPLLAAKERTKRRNQFTTDLFSEESRGLGNDISTAEVTYEDNVNFDEYGIQMEPFNLDNEREEGYFDADGNFVEYVKDNEIKDAWLDSVEVNPKYAERGYAGTNNKDDFVELSSDEIGKIKRRISDLLEPGETVLQALRRLKGTSTNRKEKMSGETKFVFDQLTEDAMKLMDNGEYNVYHEKQEVFEREAEGYETLLQAREGSSIGPDHGNFGSSRPTSLFSDPTVSSLNLIRSAADMSDAAETYDMFGDDDELAGTEPPADGGTAVLGPSSDVFQQTPSALNSENAWSADRAMPNDYVYDESSGYYYSSSLGYYYDPSTGLYCSASSGQWYSFNEETNTYDEVQEEAFNEETNTYDEVQEEASNVV